MTVGRRQKDARRTTRRDRRAAAQVPVPVPVPARAPAPAPLTTPRQHLIDACQFELKFILEITRSLIKTLIPLDQVRVIRKLISNAKIVVNQRPLIVDGKPVGDMNFFRSCWRVFANASNMMIRVEQFVHKALVKYVRAAEVDEDRAKITFELDIHGLFRLYHADDCQLPSISNPTPKEQRRLQAIVDRNSRNVERCYFEDLALLECDGSDYGTLVSMTPPQRKDVKLDFSGFVNRCANQCILYMVEEYPSYMMNLNPDMPWQEPPTADIVDVNFRLYSSMTQSKALRLEGENCNPYWR